MDQITAEMEMVDHIHQPAFCVKEGIIVKSNPAAQIRMLGPGTSVLALFEVGQEDYETFTEGCLFATLRLDNQICGVSITRKRDFDLFLLLPDSERLDLRVLSLAARELREPLSSLMITTGHLFTEGTPQDPAARESAARMTRSLFQLLRIVGNMADASRFESDLGHRMELRDVCTFVQEITEKAKALAETAGVYLLCSIHPEPVYSEIDCEKLERSIYNLLSNALKFTPAGGRIHLSLTRRGNKLSLSVCDSGQGVCEPLRGDIFSRYTREPGVEDSRFGIGLGLVLVRATAALHGGTVLVDQPKDMGLRVTMTLAVRTGTGNQLRSPVMRVDYAGEWDHGLVEFSDTLPASLYIPKEDTL